MRAAARASARRQLKRLVRSERQRANDVLERRALGGRIGDRERVRLPAAKDARCTRDPHPDVLPGSPT